MVARAVRRHIQTWLLSSAQSVRQHAKYDAQLSPPQPSGDVLSPTEAKLKERLDHRVASLVHARDIALRSERVNAISNDLTAAEASFHDLVNDTKNLTWLEQRKFLPLWTNAKQLIHSTQKDRNDFKSEHLLRRQASYSHPLKAIGTMALAGVGETAVNAILFAQVSSWGAAGGAAYSVALASPNLALGFIGGFFGLRGLSYVRPAVRWFAGILTLATFAGGVLWNFYVGHLRVLAEGLAAKRQPLSFSQWHDVTGQILAHPAAVLGSPQGIILIAVGAVVFAVAVYEGYAGVADKYIGYARVDRAYRRAISAAIALKWRFFAKLTRLTQSGIDDIGERARGIDKTCKQGQRILDRARTIIARFNQRAADCLWVHIAVTREYMALNRRMRGEKNLPSRFDQPLEFDITLPDYDWRGMREKLRAAARAAGVVADRAIDSLVVHRNGIIADIDNEPLDGETLPITAVPALPPPPPPSQPAMEAA